MFDTEIATVLFIVATAGVITTVGASAMYFGAFKPFPTSQICIATAYIGLIFARLLDDTGISVLLITIALFAFGRALPGLVRLQGGRPRVERTHLLLAKIIPLASSVFYFLFSVLEALRTAFTPGSTPTTNLSEFTANLTSLLPTSDLTKATLKLAHTSLSTTYLLTGAIALGASAFVALANPLRRAEVGNGVLGAAAWVMFTDCTSPDVLDIRN